MVSSYTPTLAALLQARRNITPIRRKGATALLVAEPYANGLEQFPIETVVEEVNAVVPILTDASVSPIIVGDLDLNMRGPGALVKVVIDSVPEVAILHLACHGLQDLEDPLESGFCLRDGKLTVAELMKLNLPHAFLAFLSACETAKGDHAHQPDQAVHLAAAMLFTGFRSVIATMW